jgi:hypothetical protein
MILNVRTMEKYLTWREKPDELLTPGVLLSIPTADLYDGVATAPARLLERCAEAEAIALRGNRTQRVKGVCPTRCFDAGSPNGSMAWWAATSSTGSVDLPHIAPDARLLGGSVLRITASKALPLSAQPTACHRAADTWMCHMLFSVDLFEVTTVRVGTDLEGQQVVLFIMCHKGTQPSIHGCHVLAPGDRIFPGKVGNEVHV